MARSPHPDIIPRRDALHLDRIPGYRSPESRSVGPRLAKPLDPQLRTPASRDPYDTALGPGVGRRARRRVSAAHWLSPQWLRKARRAPQLQPIRDHRRSDGLLRADLQRAGLASDGRKADGDRAYA